MEEIRIEHPTRVIKGQIKLSGSKSISNRALIIRALCPQPFRIDNLSDSDDTKTLQSLLVSDELILDAGHAGTTFRFMVAYCALLGRECVLTGSERMLQRPIGPLVDALRTLGADISYSDQEGYPPLRIGTTTLMGHEVVLPSDISSQYISALLLIAPMLPYGLTIRLGSMVVSRPYIDMTLSMMRSFGVHHSWVDRTIRVDAQEYLPRDYYVESDWSSASYLYAIAALSDHSSLTIHGLMDQRLQGDSAIHQVMRSYGVDTAFGDHQITITKGVDLSPAFFEYDFIKVPDIVQTMAVVAAAKGTQTLYSGLQTLKIKETDRVAALRSELKKLNVDFTRMPDKFSQQSGIEYYMQSGQANMADGVVIDTFDDHRMAMSFAALGMQHPIAISDPQVVSKSYSNFWQDLEYLGFSLEYK